MTEAAKTSPAKAKKIVAPRLPQQQQHSMLFPEQQRLREQHISILHLDKETQ